MFFFGIHDKCGAELPFIQMLTLHDACLVHIAEDCGKFLMIYHSLRSHNPVLTLWLLLGFASPTKYFFVCVCNSREETFQEDEDWTDVLAENE